MEKAMGIVPTPEQMQWLTGDTNIINLQLVVQFSVIDPAAYLFNVEGTTPATILQKIVEANLTRLMGSISIHEILTSARSVIIDKLRTDTQGEVDRCRLGLILKSINLIRVDPPQEVIHAFNDVLDAKADRERLINEAKQYKNNLIPRVEGKAEKMISEAKAYKNAQIEQAKGDASYFESLLTEYQKAPPTTARRLYLERMEKVFPKARKYLVKNKGKDHPLNIKILDQALFPGMSVEFDRKNVR
jgi:membrane protease subunit HflK